MSLSAAFLNVAGAEVELYTVHDEDALDAALGRYRQSLTTWPGYTAPIAPNSSVA